MMLGNDGCQLGQLGLGEDLPDALEKLLIRVPWLHRTLGNGPNEIEGCTFALGEEPLLRNPCCPAVVPAPFDTPLASTELCGKPSREQDGSLFQAARDSRQPAHREIARNRVASRDPG
jgi:hypothetical protein